MIILGIETAMDQAGCALGGDDGPLASFHSCGGRRHAETLIPAIDFVAQQQGIGLEQLDAVAVDIGPGLFTGLRVGVVTAKTLAGALGLPVIGLTSLDLLAYPHRLCRRLIAAVVDARRGEVFWALYRRVPAGLGRVGLDRVSEYAVGPPADVAAELMARDEKILAVGDGALRYADQLSAVSHVELGGPGDAHPSAAVLVELARPLAVAGQTVQPGELSPLYLRTADVRINWQQRDRAGRPVAREAG